MPRTIAPAEVAGLLKPDLAIYAPGAAGESPLLVDAIRAAPDASADVRFIGVWIPGINRVDYAGLHPTARSTAFFVGPALRDSFAAGRIDYVPLSYHATYAYLRDHARIDLALLHVSLPDAEGRVSLGVANDFTPAIVNKAAIKVAHVNPSMPRTAGAATLSLADLDYVCEEACPLQGTQAKEDAVFSAIGEHVATLVEDGDTVEVGVGGVQGVVSRLGGKRNLTIHAGLISDAVLSLTEAGAIADRPGAITTGVAWGSERLYAFVAEDPRVRFAPVGWTHDVGTLRAIRRFIAVNAVIEVDLLGQANAEMIGGRQISSAGGITDFMRGARLSPGGLAVVALPAAARGGSVSRIVPCLEPGTAVSVARGDMDVVVTEFGVADLRTASVDRRADALISVAAPQFREDLRAAWHARRHRM